MNNKIQKEVREFVNRNELEVSFPLRVLDLVSEVGELSKEVLKSTSYGAEEWHKSGPKEKLEYEIGDVLFTLTCIANSSGVDLQECLKKCLDKYKTRLNEKGQLGSGE